MTAIPTIVELLRGAYGDPPPHRRLPALDELILTILSQNTSDTNRDRAYRAMRERFPAWEDVLGRRSRRAGRDAAPRRAGQPEGAPHPGRAGHAGRLAARARLESCTCPKQR